MFQPPSGSCLCANVVRKLRCFFGFQLAKNVQVKDVVGFQRGVRFQLGPPVAVLRLRGKQPVRSARDGLLDLKFDVSAANSGRTLRTALVREAPPAVLLSASSIPQYYSTTFAPCPDVPRCSSGHESQQLRVAAIHPVMDVSNL